MGNSGPLLRLIIGNRGATILLGGLASWLGVLSGLALSRAARKTGEQS